MSDMALHACRLYLERVKFYENWVRVFTWLYVGEPQSDLSLNCEDVWGTVASVLKPGRWGCSWGTVVAYAGLDLAEQLQWRCTMTMFVKLFTSLRAI